jgi:uncharacterized protein (DUF2252 family)
VEIDPVNLARLQIAADRKRTAWMPVLFERKRARMSMSAHAFLRGTAPLYYWILKQRQDLRGPEGTGWIAGDLHVENFGAYRPNPTPEHPHRHPHAIPPDAVFNLNDFDDAVQAPWWLDVLRLATSLILGARAAGMGGLAAVGLAWRMLEAYPSRAFRAAALPRMPGAISKLMDKVAMRTRLELLENRTEIVHGSRRFVRGARYLDLPRDIVRAVPAALEKYRRGLPEHDRPSADHYELIDCAFRVAGTGSLGCLRVAALTVGRGRRDGAWIIDVKEEFAPSAQALLKLPHQIPAERVLAGICAALPYPPRFSGTTRLAGRSMIVRKLMPQEDKLNLAGLEEREWAEIASYLGSLTGAAHRRAALKPARREWKDADLQRLLDEAIWLAGVHEGAFLAYCHLTGSKPR